MRACVIIAGNYGGWKAAAIGAGHSAATNLLKSEYKEDITLAEASESKKKSVARVGWCLDVGENGGV